MDKPILFMGTEKAASKAADEHVRHVCTIEVHHTVSKIGLTDYIRKAREGGVALVFDEILEFPRLAVDMIAEEYAKSPFQFVAWEKKCPCGESYGPCRCSHYIKERFMARLTDNLRSIVEIREVKEV